MSSECETCKARNKIESGKRSWSARDRIPSEDVAQLLFAGARRARCLGGSSCLAELNRAALYSTAHCGRSCTLRMCRAVAPDCDRSVLTYTAF